MPLKPCKECGKEVSTEAKACPNCGAKPPKATSVFTWVVVIGLAIWLFKPSSVSNTAASPAAVAEKTPEQISGEVDAKKREDARFDFAFDSAKAVKGSLRDPDSLKWEYIGVDESANVSCLKYRAKNGFGGLNAEFAVVANGKATKSVKDWNKYCAKGHMYDLTSAG